MFCKQIGSGCRASNSKAAVPSSVRLALQGALLARSLLKQPGRGLGPNMEEGFNSISCKIIECPTRHLTVFLNGKAAVGVNG